MNRSPLLRRAAVAVLGLATLTSLPAGAYEYEQAEKLSVASGYGQMKPWDNQGNLPTGDSRLAELRGLEIQMIERRYRLEVSSFNLKMMEAQVSDKSRLASLHTDYESQMANYRRWYESADRRRQAILGPLDIVGGGELVRASMKAAVDGDFAPQ